VDGTARDEVTISVVMMIVMTMVMMPMMVCSRAYGSTPGSGRGTRIVELHLYGDGVQLCSKVLIQPEV